MENGDNQEHERVNKYCGEKDKKAMSGIERRSVRIKKIIHETGRIRIEEEHMARFTVYFLISQASNDICGASLAWSR